MDRIPYYHDPDKRAWVFPRPSNFHVHFRFLEEIMRLTIPLTAQFCCYATAMPNFQADRIRQPSQAIDYRARVHQIGRAYNPNFTVNVPLFLEEDTDPSIIRAGFEQGAWIAAKLYSQYATNNSDEGVDLRFLDRIQPALAEMATLGMILLGHFELVFLPNGRDKFDPLDRERGAILYVEEILKRNPKLRVVFEHVTSKEAVDAIVRWKARGYRVEATVAPQYLLWVHQTLFEGGINPGMYAIPILKHPKDREALTNFILDHGFFGDDSAPHDIKNKAMVCGCRGGVFNAPVSLSIYFKVFKESGLDDWFKRFVKFVSVRGPEFYGLPVSERQLAMVEEPWQVPEYYELGETKIWPMLAGQTVDWRPRLLEHVAV